MTPLTIRTEACRTRRASSMTRPMLTKAPIKAELIIRAELTVDPRPRTKTMTRATASLAPEEMPRTKGPAIGLPKKVCRRKPDKARAPPRITAAAIRGSRTFQRILCSVVPCLKISPAVIFTLPILTLSRSKMTKRIKRITVKRITRFFIKITAT